MSAITNVQAESSAQPVRGAIKKLHQPSARERLVNDIYTDSINRNAGNDEYYLMDVAILAKEIYQKNSIELKSIKDKKYEDKLSATLSIVEQVVKIAVSVEKRAASKKNAAARKKTTVQYAFVHDLTCYCIFDRVNTKPDGCCVIC